MSAKDALDALLQQQEALPRGPRREGTFAVWLLARVALDVGRANADTDRAERRRLALLERRLGVGERVVAVHAEPEPELPLQGHLDTADLDCVFVG